MIIIDESFLSLISKSTKLVLEVVDYLDERTEFNKNKKSIILNYYGLDINKENVITNPKINLGGSNDEYNHQLLLTTTYGTGNNQETSLLIKNSDGTYINRFFFKEYKIIEGGVDTPGPHSRDVLETLEIIEVDDVVNLELHTYFSIFKDNDVIAVKRKLINKGGSCIINKLLSLELPINSRDLKIYTYDGKWLYERSRHEVDLNNGIFMVDSKVGSSSHKHNPFVEVYDKTNNVYYGFNLIYSGNHKEVIDVNPLFHSSLMVGINDFAFEYPLNKNEEFITPEAIMCLSDSLDNITLNMHRFISNHIVEERFRNNPRPIIFNNWEGTGMNINETNLYEMALVANKVGVEQFVMDDGWFFNRNNSLAGLGDWFIDKNKFPIGLASFTQKIRDLNMKFGIWVEPEMININTKLFKEHPEYASIIPHRDPIEKRNQLMIDMANPDVVDYLFNSLSEVFIETKCDYVKWDYNRFFIDPYTHASIKGDYAYNFMMGTYKLIERLKEKFPHILFESCSSGGGRYDLGMIYYMPQTWGSDDTNTYCRSFIACGTLAGYPQSTYGAHVSVDHCPLPDKNRRASLEDRFNLSATGAFGYEFDFRRFGEEELNIIAKQIEYYKKHKKLFQFGDFYINDNVFDNPSYYSFNLVSEDKKEAMLYISELTQNELPKTWKLKGLDENKIYKLEMREQYNIKEEDLFKGRINGKELMEKGIDVGSISNKTTDKDAYSNGIYSRLIYLVEE